VKEMTSTAVPVKLLSFCQDVTRTTDSYFLVYRRGCSFH